MPLVTWKRRMFVSLVYSKIISANLGNYQADMKILPTALSQSKLLIYFQ